MRLGKTVYDASAQSCHGADGRGMPPHYPPLAGNQSIQMESAVNPIRMVLNGGFPPGTAGNPKPYGMPPFAQLLSDDEVAAVVTYIRTSWGNRGAAVSARQAEYPALRCRWIEAAHDQLRPTDRIRRQAKPRCRNLAAAACPAPWRSPASPPLIVIGLWFAFYLLVFVPRAACHERSTQSPETTSRNGSSGAGRSRRRGRSCC